ncbi:MAG TPA: efflux RND transporter permease subunit [Thermoanaerobaculia bacterium]|nr:efflux RND transporter permease subunit [Thermoanaerobaculia bacterium]
MIRQAIERPVSTLIAASSLVVLGAFSLFRLPVSLLPSVERPGLEITATAEGRSRDEVLDRVTRPLERRLAALAGVTSVRTRTADGVVKAHVESEWQTDADRLRIEAERRLSDLDGVTLAVELTAGDPEPIVEVGVLGGGGAERTAFAERLLVPELARLPGAGRVETVGLAPRHAVVRPRTAALAARGLTPADLVARLETVGIAVPAGRARSGAAVRPLLVREEVTSLDALGALRVPGPHGESVLGDLAGISLEEVRDGSLFRIDGQEGVLVRVFRAPEANAVALAANVRERVGAVGTRAGSGLHVRIVDDRSREVVTALSDLGIGAFVGLLLGTLAIRAFLGRWRPTLALAVVVPASVLATFTAFYLAGASLDVVSLAGLALAAGTVVDSSIVVLEAIESARARGETDPVLAGTRQIALPVIAGSLTTAVVFLPLIYLQGLARAFFGVQAFAIVASQVAALLFSLTVTPVLAGNASRAGGSGWNGGRGLYLRLLDGALRRPVLPVLAGLAVLALAGLSLVLLPRELVPDAPARELVARYRLAPDLTPEAALRLGRALEARARAALGNAAKVEKIGIATIQATAEGLTREKDGEETGRLLLAFPDAAAAERALPALRSALGRLPEVDVRIEPRTSAFVEPIERSGRRLEVVALAATPERAANLAGRAAERLRAAGLRETGAHRDRPHEALLLAWDLPRLAAAGADRDQLENQIRFALTDQTAGRLHLSGVEPEIHVKPPEPFDPALLPISLSSNPSLASLQSLPSLSPVVPLAALARLVSGARPADLERQDGRPAARLAFDGTVRDPGALLAGLPGGANEELAPGGKALELVRAFGQLRLALILSLVLVFLTLAALYESFRLPLVVMSTVPIALGGALGLLLVTGQSLDVLSFLGLILLGGIVVSNAIVIVHRAEERRRAGELIDEALRRAGAERYRPVMMTTLTTLAGMLPLAVLGGEGAELRQSLATAVVGGMVTATFASLLLVPVLQRALAPRQRPRLR